MFDIFFVKYHKRWKSLLKDLSDVEKHGKPVNFEKTIIFCNLLSKMLQLYVHSGINFYGSFSFYQRHFCHHVNEKEKLNFVCDTYFATWYIIDIPYTVIRLCIFVAQYISISVILHRGSAIMYLIYECTEILVTHFNLLKQNIVDIMEIKLHHKRNQELRKWVEHHNYLLV